MPGNREEKPTPMRLGHRLADLPAVEDQDRAQTMSAEKARVSRIAMIRFRHQGRLSFSPQAVLSVRATASMPFEATQTAVASER